jgi:DNA-directed RNA polymerase subunit RPC12/RpoP
MTKQIRCPNCNYKGKGKWIGLPVGLNILYMILAIMFVWTIIAPILYVIWFCENIGKNACPDCGNKMIVVDKKK